VGAAAGRRVGGRGRLAARRRGVLLRDNKVDVWQLMLGQLLRWMSRATASLGDALPATVPMGRPRADSATKDGAVLALWWP